MSREKRDMSYYSSNKITAELKDLSVIIGQQYIFHLMEFCFIDSFKWYNMELQLAKQNKIEGIYRFNCLPQIDKIQFSFHLIGLAIDVTFPHDFVFRLFYREFLS